MSGPWMMGWQFRGPSYTGNYDPHGRGGNFNGKRSRWDEPPNNFNNYNHNNYGNSMQIPGRPGNWFGYTSFSNVDNYPNGRGPPNPYSYNNYYGYCDHQQRQQWLRNPSGNFQQRTEQPQYKNNGNKQAFPKRPPTPKVESKMTETKESDEVLLPGSKAAREKERAEIAQRLKALDENKDKKNVKDAPKSVSKLSSKTNAPSKSDVKNSSKPNASRLDANRSKQRRNVESHHSPRTPTRKSNSSSSSSTDTSKAVKRKVPVVKVPSASKKPAKRSKSGSECSDKSQRKSKGGSSEELKTQILARLSAMGKDELRFMIHNPSSAKAQDILKTLMKCYQESKALELDKRRFSMAQTSSSDVPLSSIQDPLLSSTQTGFMFPDLPSITMTDLPPEVVMQIESFLGCDIFPTPILDTPVNTSLPCVDLADIQSDPEILPEPQTIDLTNNEDNLSDCDTVRAPSPPEQEQPNMQFTEETPFLILGELSRIDMFIQESIKRKMQLYQQLHAYIEFKMKPGEDKQQEEIPGATVMVPNGAASSPDSSEQLPPPCVPKTEENEVQETKICVVQDAGLSSVCQDCLQLSSQPPPLTFNFPDKTNVNDMKVVSRRTVVLACEDGGCYGYSLISGKLTHAFQGHSAPVTVVCGVQANPEDTKFELCSGSMDEHLTLFDSETQRIISKHYLASTITCLEREQDRVLYIGLQCGQILKYDLQARELLEHQLDCGNSINAILPSREGPRKVLIVSAKGKPLAMRDATSGLLLRTFVSTTNERSFSVAIYADRLFSGATKYSVPVFDLLSGDHVNELAVDGTVSCIQHYKHLLFVASYNGKVFVFDLRTDKCISVFTGAGLSLKTLQVLHNRVITCSRSKAMISVAFPKEVAENLKAACTCCSSPSPC